MENWLTLLLAVFNLALTLRLMARIHQVLAILRAAERDPIGDPPPPPQPIGRLW